MKTLFFVILLVFVCNVILAQNLLPNGDFELFDSTKVRNDEFTFQYIESWKSANEATPDIITPKIYSTQNGYIKSYYAEIKPKGLTSVGVILYQENVANYREYIKVKLSQPLTKDAKYKSSFWVATGQNLKYEYYPSHFDVAFSKKSIEEKGVYLLYPKAFDIKYTNQKVINNADFKEVSFIFIADDDYEYLYFGSFAHDTTITKELLNNSKTNSNMAIFPISYLFVDNFSLEPYNEPKKQPKLTLVDSSYTYTKEEKYTNVKLKFRADSLSENTTHYFFANGTKIETLKTKNETSIEFEIENNFMEDKKVSFQLVEAKDTLVKSNVVEVAIKKVNTIEQISFQKKDVKLEKDSTLIKVEEIAFALKYKELHTSFDVFLVHEKDTLKIDTSIIQASKDGVAKKDSLWVQHVCYKVLIQNDSIRQVAQKTVCFGDSTPLIPNLTVSIKIDYSKPNAAPKTIEVRGFHVTTITALPLSQNEKVKHTLFRGKEEFDIETTILQDKGLVQEFYVPYKKVLLEDTTYYFISKSIEPNTQLINFAGELKTNNEDNWVEFDNFSFAFVKLRPQYKIASVADYEKEYFFEDTEKYIKENTVLHIKDFYFSKDLETSDSTLVYITDGENERHNLRKILFNKENKQQKGERFMLPNNLKKSKVYYIELFGAFYLGDKIHSFYIDEKGNINISKK